MSFDMFLNITSKIVIEVAMETINTKAFGFPNERIVYTRLKQRKTFEFAFFLETLISQSFDAKN